MALQAFPVKRVQEAAPVTNLIEITPKNWRRYPGKVITKAMTDRVNLAGEQFPRYHDGAADWGGGAEGSDVDTASASFNTSNGYGPLTQFDKATALGVDMAPDVGIDYGEFAGTVTREGTVVPEGRYPSVNAAETPAAFRRSNYEPPVPPGP